MAHRCWAYQKVVVTFTVLALMAGCKDDGAATQMTTYTEAGVPFQVTEAGLVYYTEAGPIMFTEAGPMFVSEAGPTPVNDAGPTVPWVCEKITCLGKQLECGDCIDNDGDGKVDAQDPECLGPCDNTEGPALISGVGGVTGSTCHVDCYFDYGNGMGNDTCWWDHECDPLEPEEPICTYKPEMVGKKFCPQPQDQACMDYCIPLTPNGCDCFGCCTFPALGEDTFVWIGAKDANGTGTCTFADILDKTKCPLCTPVPGCYNPCGKCELCLGKTTLPPECYTATPPPTGDGGTTTGDGGTTTTTADAGVPPTAQCPGGETPCGLPGQPACTTGYYCISGCCIMTIQ